MPSNAKYKNYKNNTEYIPTEVQAPTYVAPENNVQYVAPIQTAEYIAPEAYKSGYQGQIDEYLGKIANREAFEYNPLEDASYQSLAKIYNKRGEQAAKNTMGDAAMLNGGYGSSYAVSAAQQARNDYNQEFAALVPQLEQNAYERYLNNFQMDLSALGALTDIDNAQYGRYRDNVSDRQKQYEWDYQKDRDAVSDAQWKYNADYNAYRDSVADAQWQYGVDYDYWRDSVADADADYARRYQQRQDNIANKQWVREFNADLYFDKQNLKLAKKASSSSGRRSTGGGTGYSGSGNTTGYDNYWDGKTYVVRRGDKYYTSYGGLTVTSKTPGAVPGKKNKDGTYSRI